MTHFVEHTRANYAGERKTAKHLQNVRYRKADLTIWTTFPTDADRSGYKL